MAERPHPGYDSVRTRSRHGLLVIVGIAVPEIVGAQLDLRPHGAGFWAAAGGAVTLAALLDERTRTFSMDHRSGLARTLADAGNAAGTGRNIIAGLAVTYVAARLTHHRPLADKVLRVAAGYAVSNAIVGVIKPLAGRHRPDSTNDAWRFRPFSARGEWHSLPSSHAVHAFSLASGIAIASDRSWLRATAYTGASLVAWSRLYDDQHWASDVTTSAVIGIATAETTMAWLDRRWPPPAAAARAR